MKRAILVAISFIVGNGLFAQMHVKQYNFQSFSKDEAKQPALLMQQSSTEAKKHPEFGILPYNAQCKECVELIDKRTEGTRLYIDPKDAGHTYSQSSYFPLHYKESENDIWRTIDPRLRPVVGRTGIYEAKNQVFPTTLDLNRKSVAMDLGDMKFEFNRNLKMYFVDGTNQADAKRQGDYSTYTVGNEGLSVKNMWPGIEMQQIYKQGEIETNYVIKEPLQLPVTNGYMVIEDHFTLPIGYVFEEAKLNSTTNANGLYEGDYYLKTAQGQVLASYGKPSYIDARAVGMPGSYKLLRDGNDYTLQMYIPVEWLNRKTNTYPLTIDPPVYGGRKVGNFRSAGLSGNLLFSSKEFAACTYNMIVTVPGNITLTNAYVDMEYEMTYDNMCGYPDNPVPPPYCTFSQVSMEVMCDACHTTTGKLNCNPAKPPYTGTCTTDPNLVTGARPIRVNSFIPDYISCIPRQCDSYEISFTLMNQDSICSDSCGTLCARGNIWAMTVEGVYDTIVMTGSNDTVCAGERVILTGTALSGTSPFQYIWSESRWLYDSISNAEELIFYPQESTDVYLSLKDVSDCPTAPFAQGRYHITVLPATVPVITVSGDTLISSSSINNQWYNDDIAINGATGQQYIITGPGKYRVQVTDDTCMPFSSPVVIAGIKDNQDKLSVDVYPNPAKSELIIEADNFQPQLILLYDMNGRKVSERKFTRRLDISVLAPGMYFIEVKGADVTARRQFIKE